MKLYTRRGDAGETDLLGGGRVAKDDQRVEAYGAVDELNTVLGVCAAASGQDDLHRVPKPRPVRHAVQIPCVIHLYPVSVF